MDSLFRRWPKYQRIYDVRVTFSCQIKYVIRYLMLAYCSKNSNYQNVLHFADCPTSDRSDLVSKLFKSAICLPSWSFHWEYSVARFEQCLYGCSDNKPAIMCWLDWTSRGICHDKPRNTAAATGNWVRCLQRCAQLAFFIQHNTI